MRAGRLRRDRRAARRSRRWSCPRRSAGRPRTRGPSAGATAPRSCPRPRPIRDELVGAGEQRRAAERRRPSSRTAAMSAAASPYRFERSRHVGQVEPRPGRLPDPAAVGPSRRPRSRATRAPPSACPAPARTSPSAWASAGPAMRPARRGALAVAATQRSASSGRCAREQGPRAGHDERDEERPLAGALGDRERLARSASAAPGGSPATSVELGEAPERRQDHLDVAVSARPRPAPRRASAGRPSSSPRPSATKPITRQRAERRRAGSPARRAPGARCVDAASQSPCGPGDQRRRRRHLLAAVRLLDRVGVLEALARSRPRPTR